MMFFLLTYMAKVGNSSWLQKLKSAEKRTRTLRDQPKLFFLALLDCQKTALNFDKRAKLKLSA